MRDGCRLANIGIESLSWLAQCRGPERAHGNVRALLNLHPITNERASAFVRFSVATHAVLMQHARELSVVRIGNEIAECLPVVPEESIARGRAHHNVPCEHGEPGTRIIATTRLELSEDIVGPVGDPRLIAVRE